MKITTFINFSSAGNHINIGIAKQTAFFYFLIAGNYINISITKHTVGYNPTRGCSFRRPRKVHGGYWKPL